MNAKFFEEQRREMVAAIRAIAEHIAAELGTTGRPSVHATPEQAMLNLKTTYAIERAVATGQAVRLD